MKNKKTNSINFMIFCFIILICVIISVLTNVIKSNVPKNSKLVATVSINGKEVMNINLDESEDKIIDLSKEYSVSAKLEIKNHQIRFYDVDCPDKICEKAGFLKENLDMAVCMPNKTIVRVKAVE